MWPFRQIKATVIKHFEARDSCQISVSEDEKVILIGKEGYREGWWKIRNESIEVILIIN